MNKLYHEAVIQHLVLPFLLLLIIFSLFFIAETLLSADCQLTDYYYPRGNLIYQNKGSLDIRRTKIFFNLSSSRENLSSISVNFKLLKKIPQETFLFLLQENEAKINYQRTFYPDVYSSSQYFDFEFSPMIDSKDKFFESEIKLLGSRELSEGLSEKINPVLKIGYARMSKSFVKESIDFLGSRLYRGIKIVPFLGSMGVFIVLVNLLNWWITKKFRIDISIKTYFATMAFLFAFFLFLATSQNIDALLFTFLITFTVCSYPRGRSHVLLSVGFIVFILGFLFFTQFNQLVGNRLGFWSYLFFLLAVLLGGLNGKN